MNGSTDGHVGGMYKGELNRFIGNLISGQGVHCGVTSYRAAVLMELKCVWVADVTSVIVEHPERMVGHNMGKLQYS